MNNYSKIVPMNKRFRGLLPVVIDIETSGLSPADCALLEVAVVLLDVNEQGKMVPVSTSAYHVEAFAGARFEAEAAEITGIDPTHPFRHALPERQVLERMCDVIRQALEKTGCYRAVLVGHNVWFDLSFILAAVKRANIEHLPFHRFTTFDTASLSAVTFGETVLARAMRRARIPFDTNQAHSAIYDAEKTAELFCHIVNRGL
jgi:ribonuclease T